MWNINGTVCVTIVLTIFATFTCVVAQQNQNTYVCQPFNQDVTDSCLGCICEASSRCNATIGCLSSGLCGPFLISRAFWVDAGRCTVGNDNPSSPTAFANCAADLVCSANAIRSYVNRFAKDCNGDQLITCEDYVMLHKNGGYTCARPSLVGTPFWKIFTECKGFVIQNGNNI